MTYKKKPLRSLRTLCEIYLSQRPEPWFRTQSTQRKEEKPARTHSVKMIEKLDIAGRQIYSMRMGIVKPVFANIRYHKQMNKFTLRTKEKVNIQWLFYSMVHTIEKIVNFGWDKYVKQKEPEIDIESLSYI